jgi:hypothetical protein
MTSPALLKGFFTRAQASGRAVSEITLETMDVRSVRGSLSAVIVLGTGVPRSIVPCRPKPPKSKAKVGQTPEVDLMDEMFASMVPDARQPSVGAREKVEGVRLRRKLAHVLESDTNSSSDTESSTDSGFSDDVPDEKLAKKAKVRVSPACPVEHILDPPREVLALDVAVEVAAPGHVEAPAAEAVEAPRARRVGDEGWPRLLTGQFGAQGDSFLRLSVNHLGNVDLRASCGHCGKTFSRTCKPDPRGQGRPMGMLGAWLSRGSIAGCQHRDVWPIPYEERVIARAELDAVDGSEEFFKTERKVDSKLDDVATGEPVTIP